MAATAAAAVEQRRAAAAAAALPSPLLPPWLARRRGGFNQELLEEALGPEGGGPNRRILWACQNPNLDNFFSDPRLASAVHSGGRSLLALAAAAGNVEAIRRLLARGAVVDTPTLCHAVWSLNLEGVQELLRAPLLPERAERRPFQCALASSPVLVLLRSHQEASHEVVMHEVRRAAPFPHDSYFLFTPQQKEAAHAAAAPLLAGLEKTAVRLMEVLRGAGYQVEVYRETCGVDADGVWRMRSVEGLQDGDLEQLEAQGCNRLVWRAFAPEPWSTQNHRHHAAAFKAAIKTLLLAAHRRRQPPPPPAVAHEPRTRRQRVEHAEEEERAAQACLADLDGLLLLKVCGFAAQPLSCWLDV